MTVSDNPGYVLILIHYSNFNFTIERSD